LPSCNIHNNYYLITAPGLEYVKGRAAGIDFLDVCDRMDYFPDLLVMFIRVRPVLMEFIKWIIKTL
jgi:hypothetical protein